MYAHSYMHNMHKAYSVVEIVVLRYWLGLQHKLSILKPIFKTGKKDLQHKFLSFHTNQHTLTFLFIRNIIFSECMSEQTLLKIKNKREIDIYHPRKLKVKKKFFLNYLSVEIEPAFLSILEIQTLIVLRDVHS